MTMTPEQAAWFQGTFTRLVDNIDKAVQGKREVVSLVLAAMLAEGHVLLEDAPGTGKTSLAKALAATVQGTSSRIQFTPDLLPSDVTGVTIYDQQAHKFEFHKGPIFSSIVLADEINRASPKTQSALLEVMEESKVTVDGVTHEAGRPFLVIATQNPVEQAGTYKLPEAQLDRFLIKTSIGYPDLAVTELILAGASDRNPSSSLSAMITTGAVADMADLAASAHVEPAVLRYVAELAEATRNDSGVRLGVSVRGAIAMIRLAKVWAAAHGRHYVLPDDIKTLIAPSWQHRLMLDAEAEFAGTTADVVINRVLETIAAPQARTAA
ncbi:AAA family ATPase [Microbacterium murale]|uniref:MoxR-like ATPase n=1 Tax=Microbacterium murale TaxID=1081040 RepID=A0ABQ1S4Y6_9MICO|nr:MoxR family ATPase [Microbacterium murale]GGD90845.1 MoxR-like ATPase [Microbacterium murale]